MPHTYNIILSNNCIIGDNVKLFHSVTIGERHGKVNTRIGDNVLIGTGSVIIGVEEVGKNVKISANSTVLKSVEEGLIVSGIYK